MIRIGIDVVSGDNTSKRMIRGCLSALEKYLDIYITVIGYEGEVEKDIEDLRINKTLKERLDIKYCDSIVTMEESPAVACRKKPNSSVMLGVKLVKEKKIDAFFSPGNTGASLSSSLYILGRIRGVRRPAIGLLIPNKKGRFTLLLDGGANMDCIPKYLKQFAIMGVAYYEFFFGKENPSYGLLNVGEEEGKGNDLTIGAYDEIKNLPYKFVGNIEPKNLVNGDCDVLICDGFSGNILLKTMEATSSMVMGEFKQAFKEKWIYKLGLLALKEKFKQLKKKYDPKQIGCAPLIGVDGNIFIGHGDSDQDSVVSAIDTMLRCLSKDPIEVIKENIKKLG